MRKFLMLSVMLLTAITLFACGNSDNEGNSGSSSGDTGESSDTIVIGVDSDWKTMDPSRAYEVFANLYFYAAYENLYMMQGEDYTPEPVLAKDHSIDDSGLVYTFDLEEGREFASGNEITADDVVFSFNRTINLKDNAAANADNVEKVETVDDNTVEVTLKSEDASFITKLASNTFAVLDSELLKENGGTDSEDASTEDDATDFLEEESAGSGPYVLDKWTENTEMVLKENPNYDGTVNASKIIIKELPDPNTQIQSLENGDIDVALSVGPDQLESIESSEQADIVSSPTSTMTFLVMNHDADIGDEMSDPLVQDAVRYAIDYQGLKQLSGEDTLLPLSFVQDGFAGAEQKPDDYQDIEKAKDLMKEAGYEDGFTVPLTAAEFDSEGMSWTTMAEKIKEDLEEINIDVEIETGEIGVVIEDYRNGEKPFLLMHWSPDYYDLNNQLAFNPGETVGNRANWGAEDHEELVKLADEVVGETDEDKRDELSKEMQEIMLEDSPYAFLLQHPKSFAVNSNLEGVTYNDINMLFLNELELTE